MQRHYWATLEGEYRDGFDYCEVTMTIAAPDIETAIKLARQRASTLPDYDCSRWWVTDIWRVNRKGVS